MSDTVSEWWAARAWIDGRMAEGVHLRAQDGVLVEVRVGVAAPVDVKVLDGIVLPGAVNAHSHAFHRALRGRTHVGRDSFWAWREQMYTVAGRLTPDSYARLARAVFGEMLLAGYTCVGEFHYVHHRPDGTSYNDPNAMSHALVAAAHDVGIRMTLLDTLYLESAPGMPLLPEQVRFSDGGAEGWLERTAHLRGTPMVRHGLAVHSVRAVPPDAIRQAARATGDRDCVLHAHVSEQPRENHECVAAYGRTPVEVLADAGALGASFTAVHATHLTDSDVDMLAGSAVCMCATTERELADGIGPAPSLRDAGAQICLGSDSHAVLDAFEEARAIELDERLGSRRRGTFTGAELWAAASAGGARSLGWPDGGIAVDQPADFIEVSPESVRLAGGDGSIDGVIFAASAPDVRTVVVAGVPRVRGGRHVSVDVAAELDAAIREVVAP